MSDQDKNTVFNKRITDNIRLNIKQPSNMVSSRPRGQRLPHIKPRTIAPTSADVINSKLVKPINMSWTGNMDDKQFQNEILRGNNYFDTVSNDTTRTIQEVDDIMNALPDTMIAERILVNSIISPNDLISKEITYSTDTKIFGDVTSTLLDKIKDYFSTEYKLQDKLADMLSKALFREGSYISVILPESSIDDAINSNLTMTTESKQSLLTTTTSTIGYVAESSPSQSVLSTKLGYSVTDNFELFKVPSLERKAIADKVASKLYRKRIGAGTEVSRNRLPDSLASIYPERNHNTVNLIRMRTLEELDKATVGHPIVINIPVESFIPVYIPGEPSNHVGGFILLDESGNPLTRRDVSDQYRDMHNSFKATLNDVAGGLIQGSKDRMMEVDSTKMTEGYYDHQYMGEVYSLLFEQDLKDKLQNGGVYTSKLDIDAVKDASRIMFSRALARMTTKVVFVPKDLFSFLAFDYKQNGLGRSLLERSKALASLRMVQEMADSLANIRNAIDHKDVTLTLDPADPNPMKTMTEMLHSIQRSTRLSSPVGLLNFADIAASFHQAGWNIKAEGHEGMPDMSIDINQHTKSYPKNDSEYSDRLKNNQLMSFGISPDSIASIMGTEFATSVVSANAFLAQEALEKQATTCSFLSDFIQKYTRNSSILMEDLIKHIGENRKNIQVSKEKYNDEVLAYIFVNNLKVELPKPDLSKIELQSKSLDTYIGMVEKVVPLVISTELFTDEDIGEELAQVIDRVQVAVKNTLIRDYMIKSNILPELFTMLFTSADELDHADLMMRHQQFLSGAIPNLEEYVGLSYRRKLKEDSKMVLVKEKLEDKYANGESDSDDDEDYDDDTSDSDSDNDSSDTEGGDEDFDYNDDDLYDPDDEDADDPDNAIDALDDMSDDLDELL